jgi:hypothetical protein
MPVKIANAHDISASNLRCYGPYGRSMVSDVIDTVDPDVMAVVFRLQSEPLVPTAP